MMIVVIVMMIPNVRSGSGSNYVKFASATTPISMTPGLKWLEIGS